MSIAQKIEEAKKDLAVLFKTTPRPTKPIKPPNTTISVLDRNCCVEYIMGDDLLEVLSSLAYEIDKDKPGEILKRILTGEVAVRFENRGWADDIHLLIANIKESPDEYSKRQYESAEALEKYKKDLQDYNNYYTMFKSFLEEEKLLLKKEKSDKKKQKEKEALEKEIEKLQQKLKKI